MRTFIAIDFSPEIIRKITEIINYFRSQTPDKAIKWVAPENLHLTVKFLGEVPDNKIEDIKEFIKKSLADKHTFQIEVKGLGMYPNATKPRVIWLGIKGSEPIVEIYKILDSELQKANVQPDKRGFSPHLTIARIRRNTDSKVVQEIGKTLSKFKVDSLGSCIIDHIVLYKSVLTPKGPIYTSLLSTPLNKV